jgi:hypothetical protein
MRGFVALENPPPRTALPVNLPAGGKVKLEIACNEAFTTLGGWASNNVACNSNGPYHNSIDPVGHRFPPKSKLEHLLTAEVPLFRMFTIPMASQDALSRSMMERISVCLSKLAAIRDLTYSHFDN